MGWLAGMIGSGLTKTTRVEDIAVGVFGAFIGGEFLAAMINPPPPVAAAIGNAKVVPPVVGFTVLALALAVAGAVAMLLLLSVLRKAVGPMGARKPKRERN